MSEPKSSAKKTNLSKAIFMALPLLAVSGMAASTSRNSSHSSSRRGTGRASVVHVSGQETVQAKSAVAKRGVFAAFGRGAGVQKPVRPTVDNQALAFLRENGLLQTGTDATAQLSGELVGRKWFASESPFAHCHASWGSTYFTNTYLISQSRCTSNFYGTWHDASTNPVVMSTSVLNKTATSFDVGVTMSENSTVYAVLLLSSQPAPTSAQVIAGTDGSGAAAVQIETQAMSPGGTLSFSGLTAGANYMVYIVGRDATMEVGITPKQVNPAFETGLISDVGNWKFPKVRANSTGDFYLGQSDAGVLRFRRWNGAGFTDYATISTAGVSAAIPGVTGVYWGNEQRVDFEVDASGNLYVVFNASTGPMADTNDPYYGFFNGTTWAFAKIAETGYLVDEVDVYLDADNHVHASFTKWNAGGDSLQTATNASGSWVLNTLIAFTSNTLGTDQLHDTHMVVDSTGVTHVFYRREDLQNNGEDNYYYTSSADNYAVKTLILNGKVDQKQYRMGGVLIDDNDHLHYAYSNDTDDRSYYVTNASGSWVSTEITHGSHPALNVLDMQRAGDTFYFASYTGSGSNHVVNSYDGSNWVEGFDFVLDGWLNDRFAISNLADRIMIVSENSVDWEIHYHSGTIAGYVTAAIANSAPTDISLSNSSVNQSGGTNATVGTLSTTDANGGDTHTYTLVAGTGDTHNASFNISGSTLRANNSAALAAGNYSVRVQTSDGSASYAEAFTVAVVDDVAPATSSVSVPANATYAVGQNLDFTVNFNENATVDTGGGTPKLDLTIGATSRIASYLSGSGTSAIVFRYTVQAGDMDGDGIALSSTLDFNGGEVRDGANNLVGTTLNSIGSLTSVLVDAVPPGVPGSLDLAAASDSGSSNTDNITNDTTPTITGVAEANATITLTSSISGSLGTTTADGSGNWSFTPGTALGQGAHSITATASDASNNSSAASAALVVSIDTSGPGGHSISFNDSLIGASEDTAISVSFAAAEVGATYSYSISSSGGGTNVTGSGTIATATDQLSGIDVSGLNDGTLTISVVLTDSAGNAATAVTNTSTLDKTALTGHSVSFNDGAISTSEASAIAFTFANAETGATYSYTISSSGGGTDVTGSGTLASASAQISNINVSGLGDGTLTLSVIVTDAAGNLSSAVTDTATLDTTAASGHSVSFDDSAISASEASAIAFTFAAAEVGATYSYTISSSGGGTAIAGSGTVASAGQQIGGINVSSLGDGTLTLSVVLTDTAGNAAAAVTNTAVLDSAVPTVAITSAASNPTNAAFQATITFSKTVSGFVVGDVTASNAALSAFTDNGSGVFSVTVTPAGDGAVTLNVAANVAQDSVGNNNTAATQYSLVFDGTGPALTGSAPADNASGVQYNANINLTFDENISAGAGSISIYDAADNSLLDSIAIGSASISGTSVTVNPSANFTPTHTYYVNVDAGTVEDALGNGFAGISGNSNLNFTIANNAPVSAADSTTTNEDTAVAIVVLDNDTDVDSSLNPASVTVVNQPDHGSVSVNTATGVITFTPTADYNGSDSFTYTVGDVHGATSSAATVSVTINAVNDAPVAVADVVSTPEDQPLNIDVAANDTDVDVGDAVDASTISLVTQPANGTAAIVAGEVLYTPDLDFNGSDSFTYRIQDQSNTDSNVATVIINVSGVNDAPVATADSATTDEDTAVTIDLVGNDTDVDGTVDATSVSVIVQPGHGSVSIDPVSGEATYTPAADYFGSDSFTYVVQDNEDATSSVATVSISITSVNDAPVAVNDTVVLQEDTPHDINALGNDSDVDGTLVLTSVEIVTAPVNGSASENASGVITYTPGEDFFGSDSLTYRVQDNLGEWSNLATVTITVESVNDDPLANDDSAQTDEDTAVVIDLLANDSDVDGTLDASSISIESAASHGDLTDNTDGTFTYTPDADFFGSDSFTYSVHDNAAAVSNIATVAIDVQPVNDAPAISGTASAEVLEGAAYQFLPVISDIDSSDLSVSAINLPTWLTLNPVSGEISGTPQVGDAGDYTDIQLSVSDGTASTALATFAITVIGDNDTDGIADIDDLDDDNDGMTDEYEQTHGFDPLSDSDAAQDLDGDTISNLQEFLDNTHPNDADDYYDVTAPVIVAPNDLIIDAVALYTPVPLYQLLELSELADANDIANSLNALTIDNVDGSGCCSTEVVGQINNRVLLAPGSNAVTYRAVDAKGNIGVATQMVHVRPLVSVNKDQISVEGASVQFRVILNGRSPFYPLTIPYVIDAASTVDGNDHDLVNGTVEFDMVGGVGQTEAIVTIALLDDGEAEANEVLIVRLDDQTTNAEDLANGYDELDPDVYDINSGSQTSHRITITELNVAPEVSLQLNQGGSNTIQVTSDGGPVIITATITDPNSGDTHSLNWSASDNSLVDVDGSLVNDTLEFDPDEMVEGRYQARVTVTDNDGALATAKLFFRIVAALPVLSVDEDTDGDGTDDATEGTADSDGDGIADYLDNITAPNVLPESANETGAFLMECDPGVLCRLGQFALMGSTGGARLDPTDFADQPDITPDPAFTFGGGTFDFEVHGLPTPGQSVRVVIPQQNAVPRNGVYRKFINGRWKNFVANARNEIHSAAGNPGYCPPPGDSSWQTGLTEGHHCVQLTIQDGGPNDGDRVQNAAIEDPGGVAVQAVSDGDIDQEITGIKSKGKGSSGGSLSVLLVLMLAGLVLGRSKKLRAATRSLGAVLMATTAFSLLPSPAAHALDWNAMQTRLQQQGYLSLALYQAKGSQAAGDFEQGAAAAGVAVNLSEYDVSRDAWQFSAGYRYLDNMAIEIGFLDLGDVTVNLDASGTTNNLQAAMNEHYPVSGHGWTIANRFEWALQERITLSAEVGLFIWEGEIDLTGSDIEPDIDGGTDMLLGIAGAYRLTDNLEALLHAKRIFFDDQEVDLIGLEGRIRF